MNLIRAFLRGKDRFIAWQQRTFGPAAVDLVPRSLGATAKLVSGGVRVASTDLGGVASIAGGVWQGIGVVGDARRHGLVSESDVVNENARSVGEGEGRSRPANATDREQYLHGLRIERERGGTRELDGAALQGAEFFRQQRAFIELTPFDREAYYDALEQGLIDAWDAREADPSDVSGEPVDEILAVDQAESGTGIRGPSSDDDPQEPPHGEPDSSGEPDDSIEASRRTQAGDAEEDPEERPESDAVDDDLSAEAGAGMDPGAREGAQETATDHSHPRGDHDPETADESGQMRDDISEAESVAPSGPSAADDDVERTPGSALPPEPASDRGSDSTTGADEDSAAAMAPAEQTRHDAAQEVAPHPAPDVEGETPTDPEMDADPRGPESEVSAPDSPDSSDPVPGYRAPGNPAPDNPQQDDPQQDDPEPDVG
ncbi:hypothetical protein [Microbacterium sp.]|uniref:hypothetical protein n=1 Tax=Microbacterium sp. TaxID=51671 RepID=UPI0039E55207